ncbi:MAG: hypothetical protein KKD63_05970 [Proteobacteria bacterium]|nr:hypothetical protein [Desulfobulbaceae bacterium]MBU4152406.1 hypothetical protein [Pseudomonadota bacterium]
MPKPLEQKIQPDTFSDFTQFLDYVLISPQYSSIVTELRRPATDRFYLNDYWHSFEELLRPFPEAHKALNGFAFENWDEAMAFSSCNLKACYILDEDFVNNGRAFILFNLVASNWTYVAQVDNQLEFWEHK